MAGGAAWLAAGWLAASSSSVGGDVAAELEGRATDLEQRLAALAAKPFPSLPATRAAGAFVKGDAARVDAALGEWEDMPEPARGLCGGSRDCAQEAIRSWLEADVEPGDGHLWHTLESAARDPDHSVIGHLRWPPGVLWIVVRYESPEAARAQLEAHARTPTRYRQPISGLVHEYRPEAGLLTETDSVTNRYGSKYEIAALRIAQHREFLIHVARKALADDAMPRPEADLDRIIERSRHLIDERFAP